MNIVEIEEAIKEQEELSKKCEEKNYHKLQYSNPYKREVLRLKRLKELKETNVLVEDYGNGTCVVNRRFRYCLLSGKWRNCGDGYKGKGWWYYSKSPKQFVETYVTK